MDPAAAKAPDARTELLDADQFELTRVLRDVYPATLAELQRLADGDFVPWFDNGSYVGSWQVFPLSFSVNGQAVDLGSDLARNRARCPATVRALDAFQRLGDYGFSRMMPGTHIIPHCDDQPVARLRMHLPLVVPDGCHFRVGTEHLVLRPGEPIVFDGFIDHETANLGSTPRTTLLVDCMLSADELAYLDAVRARNRVVAPRARRDR